MSRSSSGSTRLLLLAISAGGSAWAQFSQIELECHAIATEAFPRRCGFSAETASERTADWQCSVSCAEVLLPFLDRCHACATVPGQGQDRVPETCVVPETEWDAFGDVARQCSRSMMERYLFWDQVTGCPAPASACKNDPECAIDMGKLFSAYYQSCNFVACENPDASKMSELAQLLVTCNCEAMDAPLPESYRKFVQDCRWSRIRTPAEARRFKSPLADSWLTGAPPGAAAGRARR